MAGKAGSCVVLALGLLLVASACGGGGSDEEVVSYGNGTAGDVRIAIDGVEVARIPPGQMTEVRVRREFTPDHIEAFDDNGNLVFEDTLTWEQFEERSWLVVIE